jgi:YfiH family protein
VSRVYADGLTGVAARQAGLDLNLGFTPADERKNVLENRRRFVAAVTRAEGTRLATVRQVHSGISAVIGEACSGATDEADGADGQMTDQAGVLLGILTADCIPVLVVDPVRRVVGAFHAGWRGTVERIVELGVAQMCDRLGAEPAEMLAAVGPGIGRCCYTVGDEVRGRFGAEFGYAEELFTRDGDAMRLDLIEANRRQLQAAAVAAGSIQVVGGCTACMPGWFYSHRASGGNTGRMMAVVGIRG